ncbi:hypothetical protein, variant [Aphanomyces invadans]|uniref:Helicase ATP-binding domain-containing protein n=1 Tax=Aphanomyces invadans TaxID=157072 RepID=A0A024U4T5_9STRA|nr:hypothetical protein, variant [Aphanomyces invadans]ETW00643.1 hypothetical protein, variant [Aphanomyces invadans]|eukprot:XP_008870778.1 hypothetical protein, variant [Aphanomyces invadans]
MTDDDCCCGVIPCLCVTEAQVQQAKKLDDLRMMLRTTTAACDFCLMLPCLCEGDTLEAEEPLVVPSKPVKKVVPTDAYGRVELTGSDGDTVKDLWVASELDDVLKPHQRDGVKFLLQHVSMDQGCILADYMGLGKTIQLISSIHSFLIDGLSRGSRSTALVLCPTVCILNWVQEFQKWLEPSSLQWCPIYQMDTTNSYKSNTSSRIEALEEWKSKGGVMIMGYEMFRLLLNPSRVVNEPVIDVVSHVSMGVLEVTEKKQRVIDRQLRQLSSLLCSPGPDLVALDEGHRIKDPSSILCATLEKVTTHKRIVLTGYPLQNSLAEYWCMVNFCRPDFLGSYDEFRQTYERPIVEGNVEKSSQLTTLLAPVVLRRGRDLLNAHLPTKKEWIVHCQLSPLQHTMYLDFLDRDRLEKKQWDLFTTYATLLQIVNHPDVVHRRMMLCEGPDDQDNDDGGGADGVPVVDDWQPVLSTTKQTRPKKRKRTADPDARAAMAWAEPSLLTDYVTGEAGHSGKMVVLLQLIRESQTAGDKVVVFSQSVSTLECVGMFLDLEEGTTSPPASTKSAKPQRGQTAKKVSSAKNHAAKKSRKYLVIDGSLSSSKRMEHINTFSDHKSGVDVLLVSTRAGAEGINLHAANRLVLFDVSWNPSHDHQSMCRSHRIGQVKDVHVYRFVSHDTMEEKIYRQQVKKVGLSANVVDATAMNMAARTIGRCCLGQVSRTSWPLGAQVLRSSGGGHYISRRQ